MTIAYSVEGGYTPLKWKYLGDELAHRLRQPGDRESAIRGFELMRGAALAAGGGDFISAEQKYLAASAVLPDSPAPYFHLAHLFVELGRIEEARRYYAEVLRRDPSYRTAYNSSGVWRRCSRATWVEAHRRLSAASSPRLGDF